MSYNSHFWKQVQNHQRKPSLKDEYNQILENQNVALYSRDIGDAVVGPPAPEGTSEVAIIDKDYLNKIKGLSKFQSIVKRGTLQQVLTKIAGISPKYSSKLEPVIKGALESSGYQNAHDLFEIMGRGANSETKTGFFEALGLTEYNALDETIKGISQYSQEFPNIASEGLREFLFYILKDSTKYAATNVGPGELFFILFSDARNSASSSGQKSGDLNVNGVGVEAKASDARYDGSDFITKSFETINKIIPQFKLQQSQQLQTQRFVKTLLEPLQNSLREPQTKKQLLDFINLFKSKLGDKSFSHVSATKPYITLLGQLEQYVKDCEANRVEPTLLNKTTDTLGFTKRPRTVGSSVYEVLKKRLTSKGGYVEPGTVGKIPKTDNPLNTLDSAFDAIQNSGMQINIDQLLDIICAVNSYDPKELLKHNYDLKQDLLSILGNETQSILNKDAKFWKNLIGAMHIVSYMHFFDHPETDKLLMLGTSSGDVKIFPVPLNLEQGLKVTQTPGVIVELNLDVIESGGTSRAKSVKVSIK